MTANEAIHLAANGNDAAEDYMRIVGRAARLLDNIVDQDKPYCGYELAELLLVSLPNNPFYRENRATLDALHLLAVRAWQDADKWLNSADPYQQEHAKVNRDLINEIVVYVAQMTDASEEVRMTVRDALLTRD